MFDSCCLISAEEVGTDGHQLAWSEGPRPVFEERDVSEPESKRERGMRAGRCGWEERDLTSIQQGVSFIDFLL